MAIVQVPKAKTQIKKKVEKKYYVILRNFSRKVFPVRLGSKRIFANCNQFIEVNERDYLNAKAPASRPKWIAFTSDEITVNKDSLFKV